MIVRRSVCTAPSAIVPPVNWAMYAGTSGKIHGEKKRNQTRHKRQPRQPECNLIHPRTPRFIILNLKTTRPQLNVQCMNHDERMTFQHGQGADLCSHRTGESKLLSMRETPTQCRHRWVQIVMVLRESLNRMFLGILLGSKRVALLSDTSPLSYRVL
ncbi:hypothetical protein JCM19039_79 [Geomicrobium sp. JCM 19039]|nr:hypothetical protein JCM19039_79 [Geomicrobium sp. JCM 19039]